MVQVAQAMRLLLTRALPEGAASASRLRKLGHEAVLCPVTEIVALEPAIPHDPVDAIIATSANAFCGAIAKSVLARWPNMPSYFVGSKTVQAARKAGFAEGRRGLVASDAATLFSAIRLPAPANFLYLAGYDRKLELELALQAAGHKVVVLETYAAQAVTALGADARAALQTGAMDGVLHYSRRSAEIFVRLVEQAGVSQDVLAMQHYCLSTDVAGALRDVGTQQVEIAATPDEDGLFALLPLD